MTAIPADDRARSRDLARLRELTEPHLTHRRAMIQQAIVRMNADDRAEATAILGRIGDPHEEAMGDGVA